MKVPLTVEKKPEIQEKRPTEFQWAAVSKIGFSVRRLGQGLAAASADKSN